MTPSPVLPAPETESAVAQAELLAKSITDAARFEAKRIVGAALQTDDRRTGLVRRAESLSDEARQEIPEIGLSADAVVAEIRAAANEHVRQIGAEAAAEGARIKAEAEARTLVLVTRAERRVTRLERRRHRFRKQLRAPFVRRRVKAFASVAVAGCVVAGLAVFAPDFSGTEIKANPLPDAVAAPESPLPPVCPIPAQYRRTFTNAAQVANVPVGLLGAVAETESGFNPAARSEAGARGMLQLMPTTARMLKVNPLNTRQNIRGGARYLRYLHDRFGSYEAALAAYHAGPSAQTNLSYGPGTKSYVARVLSRRAYFDSCG